MNPKHSVPSSRRADAGFTLIELLVSLAVTAVLILGVLATFDFSARMNKVQLNVADMQQSLRIAQNEVVRLSRMTGRGSLPTNIAVQVANNLPAGSKLVATEGLTEIEPLTDVLRLRGVFSSSLYQIDWQNPSVWGTPGAGGNGWVLVKPLAAGVPQDLAALLAAAKPDNKPGESLLLVTPFDIHAVAQIVDAKFEGANLRIDFKKHPNETALSGPLAAGMTAAAYIGILEEYAFYVRHGDGSDAPALAKARLEPGSSLPYKGEAENARLDLADNIYDLQVALGFGVVGAPELRLTTLVRTDRSDAGQYLAPLLPAMIGDHPYPTNHALNSAAERRHRWRLMQTSVNLRNL
ncbi:MAG TPA: prepilin-type N-terminal cleavage/methylation domain-containing protein [Thermoanaerobaculia bacterium]|jgi:prepilin-type N-terminal cleavage/methylation domain-containing protein|nr:prepilin-type N-terminal cleavage/methylation domain-containing protein [Thermoanaerobaculia bacterium]